MRQAAGKVKAASPASLIENMCLAVPPAIAATLPERARELIGYSIHLAFMGYVDGMHPKRLLGATDAAVRAR
jgi:ectoine hydroxylase-related dioxygenase (phytanoyl-CoA dioxygenase family)